MDLESKEEGSTSKIEKPLSMDDKQPSIISEDCRIEILQGDESRLSKSTGLSSHDEGVDLVVDAESSENTKLPISSPEPVFVNPDEGTPAAEALAGTSLSFLRILNRR